MKYTVEYLKELSEKEYYNTFAFYMRNALWYNSRFYVWLIDNMYEIFDRDEDVLQKMIEKNANIDKTIPFSDLFEESFKIYFKDTYSEGECIALSCVANAFLSWKTNNISMEEYYEIRDMFVPFNLPISFTVESLQPILNLIHDDKKGAFTLLSRIGKAFSEKESINDELIVLALDELNFDETE